jgi:hypothetical protein
MAAMKSFCARTEAQLVGTMHQCQAQGHAGLVKAKDGPSQLSFLKRERMCRKITDSTGMKTPGGKRQVAGIH